MKRSQLKEAIKSEIKSVLSENRYDINDPNSPMGKLNDEYESSGLKGIVDKYGLDVVLMMLSSGEYGDRLNEAMSDKEREQHIQHLMRTGAKEKPLRKLAAIGKKEDEKDLKEGKRGVVVDPDEIMMHINQYQSGNIDGDDLAQAIEEILVAMMNKSVSFSDIREEDEMTDAEKKKAAEKDAKKEKDFANKQKEVDKLKKELADNKDELVKISKISRDERTKAQQNLLDDMAKKTKELKKLRRVEA